MQSPPAVLLRGVNQPGCSERARRDVGVHAQPTRRDGLLDACSIFLPVPPGNLTRKQTNNLLEIGSLLFVVVFFHPYSTNLSGEGGRETSSRHTQTRSDATLTRLCNSSAVLEIAVEQICHLFRAVTTGLQRRASLLRSLEPYQGSNKTYFRTTNTRNVARREVRQNLSQKKKAVSIRVQVQSQYAHDVEKKQDWHSVILSRMKRSCSGARTQVTSDRRREKIPSCIVFKELCHLTIKTRFFFGWDIELAPGQQNHYNSCCCVFYLFVPFLFIYIF